MEENQAKESRQVMRLIDVNPEGLERAYVHLCKEWDKLCEKYDNQTEENTKLKQQLAEAQEDAKTQRFHKRHYARKLTWYEAKYAPNQEAKLEEARRYARKYHGRMVEVEDELDVLKDHSMHQDIAQMQQWHTLVAQSDHIKELDSLLKAFEDLQSFDVEVRDEASIVISDMDNPMAIFWLKLAVENETNDVMRSNFQLVIDQLTATALQKK